jgi:hypothetical protein
MNKTRSGFSHTAILTKIRGLFKQATQHLDKPKKMPIVDCLMSGLAIFALKYKSLLKFEEDKVSEPNVRHNLTTIYGVKKAPCDTYLRERLDGLDLSIIRNIFAPIIVLLQRGKILEQWKFFKDKVVISLDASQFFSSNQIHCEYCCEKVHNRGTDKESTTYHHQMLVGSIVSPDMKQVIPIGFEPIIKEDGSKKNDCERNCAKRWIEDFRKSHPQLPTVIVADGLYSNAPFIKLLNEKRCSYIITAKEDDHKYLYDYFWAGEGDDIDEFELKTKDILGKYRFMKVVPLNDTNHDFKVNVLYYEEDNLKKNKTTKWLWVTDMEVTKDNAKSIMQAGRERWKIENETFNTLKNQGYNYEHNFGHGYKTLSNVFAGLMLLAFLVDQCLEDVNLEFRAVMKKYGSRSNLFKKIRAKFCDFMIMSYQALYAYMLNGPPPDQRILF